MTGSSIYALQKAREAINCLAILDKPLRERVSYAAIELLPLRADKIPDDGLHKKMEAIVNKIYNNRTADDHNLLHISDHDVSQIARQIIELFEGCLELYTKRPNFRTSN